MKFSQGRIQLTDVSWDTTTVSSKRITMRRTANERSSEANWRSRWIQSVEYFNMTWTVVRCGDRGKSHSLSHDNTQIQSSSNSKETMLFITGERRRKSFNCSSIVSSAKISGQNENNAFRRNLLSTKHPRTTCRTQMTHHWIVTCHCSGVRSRYASASPHFQLSQIGKRIGSWPSFVANMENRKLDQRMSIGICRGQKFPNGYFLDQWVKFINRQEISSCASSSTEFQRASQQVRRLLDKMPR